MTQLIYALKHFNENILLKHFPYRISSLPWSYDFALWLNANLGRQADHMTVLPSPVVCHCCDKKIEEMKLTHRSITIVMDTTKDWIYFNGNLYIKQYDENIVDLVWLKLRFS